MDVAKLEYWKIYFSSSNSSSSLINYSEECINLKTVSLLLFQKIKLYNVEEAFMVRNSKAVAAGDERGLQSGGTGRIWIFSVISYFEYSCRMVYVNPFYVATHQS